MNLHYSTVILQMVGSLVTHTKYLAIKIPRHVAEELSSDPFHE
jgi:hypothetical protein